jgi:hypothetical protein
MSFGKMSVLERTLGSLVGHDAANKTSLVHVCDAS